MEQQMLTSVNPAIPADTRSLTRRHPVQQNTPICVLCAGSDNTREAAQIGCDGLGGYGARMGGHGRRCSFAVDRFRR
jgi:hypothetical protein